MDFSRIGLTITVSVITMSKVGVAREWEAVNNSMKVREVMKLLEADGWYHINTEGDHRQYKHPVKRGRVTVAGHPGDDLHPKTLASIFRQAQIERKRKY